MSCIECGSDKATVVFIEVFPCNHCNGELHLEHNLCPECGIGWKTLDGEVVECVTVLNSNLDDFFSDFDEQGDVTDMIFNYLDSLNHGSDSMNSYVHRCLRCNSIAFEIGEELYRCSDPECGFEWEVVRDG